MTVEDSFTLVEMKDGLTGPARVKQLVEEMEKEKDHVVKNASDATRQWSTVASTIMATKDRDCLDLFIQLDGLWFIHRWLEDAQMLVDDTSDGFVEESIFALLRALEKLQLDNEKAVSSGIWVTVKNLLGHRSYVVQDLARTIFYSWTQCVPGGGSSIITGASDDAVLEFPTEAEAVRCEIKSPADSPFDSSDLDPKASDALDFEAQNKLGSKDEKEDPDSSSLHVDDAEADRFKVKNATDHKEVQNKVLCDFDLNEDFSSAAMGVDFDLNVVEDAETGAVDSTGESYAGAGQREPRGLDLDLNHDSDDEDEEGLLPIRQNPSHASSSLSMQPNIDLKWPSDVGLGLGIGEKWKRQGGVWEPPAEKRKRQGGVWEPSVIPLNLDPPTRELYAGAGQREPWGLDLDLNRDSDDEDEEVLDLDSNCDSDDEDEEGLDLDLNSDSDDEDEEGLLPIRQSPSHASSLLSRQPNIDLKWPSDVVLGLGIGEKRKRQGGVWEPPTEKRKRQGGVWEPRAIPLKLDPPTGESYAGAGQSELQGLDLDLDRDSDDEDEEGLDLDSNCDSDDEDEEGLGLDLKRDSDDEDEEGLLPIRQSPSHASSSLSMQPNIDLKWPSDVVLGLGIGEKRKPQGGVLEPRAIPLKLDPPTGESYAGADQREPRGSCPFVKAHQHGDESFSRYFMFFF